eukprot:403375265
MNNNSALTNGNFPTQNSALDITLDHASNQSIIQHTKQSSIPNNSYMRDSKQQKQQIDLSTLNEEIEKVAGKHDNSVLSTQHKLMPTQQYNLNEDLSPSQQKQYVRGTPQDGLLNFKKKFGVTDTNQQPLRNMTTNVDAYNWHQNNQMWKYLYYYSHFGQTIAIILFLMIFRVYLNRKSKQVLRVASNNYKYCTKLTQKISSSSLDLYNKFQQQETMEDFSMLLRKLVTIRNLFK